jgi:hypothetical protein
MMKKSLKVIAISIMIAGSTLFTTNVIADNPPLPPENHGSNGNSPPGGCAPVGGGLVLLVTLGLGYGARKVYKMRRKLTE